MVLKSLSVALAACLSFGAVGMAATHEGHDHEGEEHAGEFDLDLYKLVLKGDQGFGEACYLGVLEQGVDADGRYFAVVETSFNHEGEGPGTLTVKLDATLNPTLLSGDNGEGRIAVQLGGEAKSILDALRYAVAWTHEDHSDRGFCADLTVVKDETSAPSVEP